MSFNTSPRLFLGVWKYPKNRFRIRTLEKKQDMDQPLIRPKIPFLLTCHIKPKRGDTWGLIGDSKLCEGATA